jgi:hypothetical protein
LALFEPEELTVLALKTHIIAQTLSRKTYKEELVCRSPPLGANKQDETSPLGLENLLTYQMHVHHLTKHKSSPHWADIS